VWWPGPLAVSKRTRPTVGAVLLLVGWVVVVVGSVLVVIGLTGPGRDETIGSGLAVVMTGMLVVLAGSYAHHRDRPRGHRADDPE